MHVNRPGGNTRTRKNLPEARTNPLRPRPSSRTLVSEQAALSSGRVGMPARPDGVTRRVRRHRLRPRALPRLLRLVQPRPSPLRDRLDHRGRAPPRPGDQPARRPRSRARRVGPHRSRQSSSPSSRARGDNGPNAVDVAASGASGQPPLDQHVLATAREQQLRVRERRLISHWDDPPGRADRPKAALAHPRSASFSPEQDPPAGPARSPAHERVEFVGAVRADPDHHQQAHLSAPSSSTARIRRGAVGCADQSRVHRLLHM